MRVWAMGAVLLGGCGACSTEPHARRDFASASVETAPCASVAMDDSPPPRPETTCDRVRTKARRSLEKLVARARADAGALGADDLSGVGACVETQHGAWSLRVIDVTPQGTFSNTDALQFTAAVALVHTDTSGRAAEITPELDKCEATFCRTFEYATSYSLESAGDVDGDGEDEIVVKTHTALVESNPVDEFRIYRFGGGAVARLAPSIDIAAVRDEDGDGKLDVVFHPYVAHSLEADCLGNSDEIDGVDFIAHATSTGYSRTDAVALKALRAQCPSAPTSIVVPGDVNKTARNIVCARVWSVSADRIIDELTTKCSLIEPSCVHKPGPRDCPAHFRDWVDVDPPLRL